MKSMQLPKMSIVKPPKPTNKSGKDKVEYANILKQQFKSEAPNRVWASDITYKRILLSLCRDGFIRKKNYFMANNSINVTHKP